MVDKIGYILIKANNNLLNGGIWEIIEKNIIPEINLTSEQNLYKKYNNILQAINLFKDNNIFCLKYKLFEGCSICTSNKESIEYLLPSIQIDEQNLKNKTILEKIIKVKLQNYQSVCIMTKIKKL